jgi:RNase P protein component
MKGGFDIVVAARPGVDRVKTQELREEMEGLLVMGRVIGS